MADHNDGVRWCARRRWRLRLRFGPFIVGGSSFELRAAFTDRQHVCRDWFCVVMNHQAETVREQVLQHRLDGGCRRSGRHFGDHVETIGLQPTGAAKQLLIVDTRGSTIFRTGRYDHPNTSEPHRVDEPYVEWAANGIIPILIAVL